MKTVSKSGLKFAVHHGHLQLEFVVRYGANTAEEHTRLALPGVVNQEAVKTVDLHVGKAGGDFAQHFGPFGER